MWQTVKHRSVISGYEIYVRVYGFEVRIEKLPCRREAGSFYVAMLGPASEPLIVGNSSSKRLEDHPLSTPQSRVSKASPIASFIRVDNDS